MMGPGVSCAAPGEKATLGLDQVVEISETGRVGFRNPSSEDELFGFGAGVDEGCGCPVEALGVKLLFESPDGTPLTGTQATTPVSTFRVVPLHTQYG